MFPVSDIFADAQNIIGTCAPEFILRRITAAVELLANKGDFDPLLGVVDICVQDQCVTLPREIETPLAVNISGHPTIGRDFLFNFHLNGPGDNCRESCSWNWQDGGEACTYKELRVPSRLIAFVANAEDANAELWVYGYDKDNKWIRTKEGNTWFEGYRVPTIFGYAVPDIGAPEFARVVRVRKAATSGEIRLSSYDSSLTTGTLIGIYRHDETEPVYRKIKLSRNCVWARIAFRRRTFKLTHQTDLIPLHSSEAVLMMIRAVKAYGDNNAVDGAAYEATAVRWITEEQETHSPPVTFPVQVNPHNMLVDHADEMD